MDVFVVTDGSRRNAVVKTGDIIEGRYCIIKTLGEGSMGAVFLAEHVLLKRRVAIRVLRPELAEDADVLDGFMNEARAAGTLGHPNIVACTDLGLTRANVPYLVLEYVEGTLLTDEIYRVGGLPVRRALKIADQIASALQAAHDAGIVHRDLKSDHVLLTDNDDAIDVVKVLDFGTSRLLGSRGDDTRRGRAMPSPEFMAPEQLTGPDTVDHRADIYAVGVILYEMLTARRPFSDDDKRALLHRVVNEPPPPLMRPEAPPGLEDMIVSKLLAKDPGQRYPSMKHVRTALDAFAAVIRPSGPVSGELQAVRQAIDVGSPLDFEPAPVPAEPAPLPAEPVPVPAEVVALPGLPGLPNRRSSRIAWLVAAVLLGGVGGGMMYLENQTAAANDHSVAVALDTDVEKLASMLDSEVRAAHLRADGVAAMPMLRAAVETDAATLKDMVGSDFIFAPKPGEVLELFQLGGSGTTTSMLRIPDSAAPIVPIAGNQTRIASDGKKLTIIVGAPIAKQDTAVGGSVAISVPLDLEPIKKRVAEHARSAAIVGFGAPVSLVATGNAMGTSVSVPIPLSSELSLGEVSLAAVIARSPSTVSSKLRIARIACWAVGAALFVLSMASLLRGRKQG